MSNKEKIKAFVIINDDGIYQLNIGSRPMFAIYSNLHDAMDIMSNLISEYPDQTFDIRTIRILKYPPLA